MFIVVTDRISLDLTQVNSDIHNQTYVWLAIAGYDIVHVVYKNHYPRISILFHQNYNRREINYAQL